MAEPILAPTVFNADAAAQAQARAQFNAERGLAFRPDGAEAPSPFDFSNQTSLPIIEALRNSGTSVSVRTIVATREPVEPVPIGSAYQQATAAAAGAVRAGVAPTTPGATGADSAGGLANAIEVLAAMTGKSPDEVRAAITSEGSGKPDLSKVKQFMGDNAAAITAAQRPENIAKLSQSQRDAMRSFLQSIGYPIDPNAYGTSPQQQAQALSQTFKGAQDGGMDPANMMMMLILGALAEAFGISGAFDSVLAMMGGAGTRGYRTGAGGMGSARSGPAKFSSEPELDRIAQNIQGRGTIAGVVNLANALDGQAEVGNNGGAIVRATMGYTGDPWCGGFVRYTFEKAGVTGVYDQADYRMARSYMRVGQQHGAFRGGNSGYLPQPGDVIVFSSSRGPNSGHVGIVTGVKDGQVTYESGNDGDKVQARTFSASNPPGNLLGYTDTMALARAKGVNLERAPAATVVSSPTTVTGPATPPITPAVPKATTAPMTRDL